MKADDQAFGGVIETEVTGENKESYEGKMIHKRWVTGLTVRDHIAIQAMNGILVNTGRNQFAIHKPNEIAEAAYDIADAMIEKSQQEQP